MKISMSLPAQDVAFLDERVRDRTYESRSAALHAAVRLLHVMSLEDQYAEAFREWEASGDAALWDSTSGDGLD